MHAIPTPRYHFTALALILAIAVACLAVAPAARAKPVFAIAPAKATAEGYFVLPARPGSLLRRAVKVTNTGDEAGDVRLYAVDATTGATTGAVYLGDDRRRRDVGAWIKLKTDRLRLAPRESKTVAFSARVPEQVRGGQHLGGIVADNAVAKRGKSRKRGKGRFTVDIHHLTITAVQVELPAKPQPRMKITGLRAGGRPGHQTIFIAMGNPGNRLIKPTLDIDVTDDGGKHVLKRSTKLDTFVPATKIDYPLAVLKRGLAPGTYEGTVVLRLGDRILDRFTGKFEVTDDQVKQIFGDRGRPTTPGEGLPWALFAIGGALLLALLAAAEHLRRKARKLNRGALAPAAPVAAGEPEAAGPCQSDTLAADQTALLALLLDRGQTYDEIAVLLSLERCAVRGRAHAALLALAPPSNGAEDGLLAPEVTTVLADYLLGQQTGSESTVTEALLASSEPSRDWVRALEAQLRLRTN